MSYKSMALVGITALVCAATHSDLEGTARGGHDARTLAKHGRSPSSFGRTPRVGQGRPPQGGPKPGHGSASPSDADKDGIADSVDNCVTVSNANQLDADCDRIGDACECAGVVCDTIDSCHEPGVCDAATGSCVHAAAADGKSCSDGDACTVNDVCQSARCIGSAVECGGGEQCINGACPSPHCSATFEFPNPPLGFAGGVIRAAAIGDLDGDGRHDVVVADAVNLGTSVEGSLQVLRGQGDGSLLPPVVEALSPQFASALALGDFNRDGNLDVAVAGSVGGARDLVRVFLGRGDGSLSAHNTYFVGNGVKALAVADLDQDGSLDLAAANYFSFDVTVLKNRGDGRFEDGVSYRTGLTSVALVASDFDGDGWADLAVAQESFSFNVLKNNGNGTFADDVTSSSTGLGNESAVSLVAADFDQDGRNDLALGYNSDEVAVLLNTDDLTFAPAARYPGGGGVAITADLNRDGFIDLVTGNGLALQSRLNQGNGIFADAVSVAKVGLPLVAAADLNGDDAPDLVAFHARSNTAPFTSSVGVLLNHGDGTIRNALSYEPAVSVATGDVNGDGIDDLVAVDETAAIVRLRLGARGGVLGDAVVYSAGPAPYSAELADLNGDDRPELIVLNRFGAELDVLLNDGSGSFGEPVPYPVSVPIGTEVADFNGDGRSDIAVVSGDDTVVIFFNDGAAAFPTAVVYAAGSLPWSVTSADFNGDGAIDILTVNRGGGAYLNLWLNQGSGSFDPPIDYAGLDVPDSVVAADFDSDGDTDVAVTAGDGLRVLFNAGSGALNTTRDYPVNGSGALARSDLDHDGDEDLIVALQHEGIVRLFINDGTGEFARSMDHLAVASPASIAVGDLNGDGASDLAIGARNNAKATVLQGACAVR
jgi:hypothetical protein